MLFEKIQIQVICPENETLRLLTGNDILLLFDMVASKIFDENHERIREKPFYLIEGFPLEKPKLPELNKDVDRLIDILVEKIAEEDSTI